MAKIENVSQKTENAILRKSAHGLPNRPSESGMNAEDVKKSFHSLITDKSDSVLAEMKRIVNEANDIIKELEDKINKKEPEISSSNLISADFIDDTNSKNKFLTDEERKLLYKFNKETWVINENPTLPIESGAYTINANVNLYDGTEIIPITADYWQFYNNAALFFGKTRYTSDGYSVYYNTYQNEWISYYDTKTAFISDCNISKQIRTITFNEEPDEEILAWLQANAVLQPNIQQIIPNNGEEATEELKTLQIGDINFLLSKGDFFFNLAYGDTAPEDTTKLWVKCQEPSDYDIDVLNINDENISIETMNASLLVSVFRPSACSVGTNCYIFGGEEWKQGYFRKEIQKYDTLTNTRTTMSATLDVSVGMAGMSTCSVGTNCYVFGGRFWSFKENNVYYNYIQKYDTLTNTRTRMGATLSNGMAGTSACAIGTNCYIFGGFYNDTYYNYIQKYDTLTNARTTMSATIGNAMCDTSACYIGNNCYIFGGRANPDSSYYNTILKYDTLTNARTTMSTTLSDTAAGTSACSIGTNCYIFGGTSWFNRTDDSYIGTYRSTIQKYDTLTNTRTTINATLPTNIGYAALAVVGFDCYIFGGHNGSSLLNSIQKVSFAIDLEENKLLLIENMGQQLPVLKYKENYLKLSIDGAFIGNSSNKGERVEIYQYNNDTQQWEQVI